MLINKLHPRKHFKDRMLISVASHLRLNHSVVVGKQVLPIRCNFKASRSERNRQFELLIKLEWKARETLFVFVPSKSRRSKYGNSIKAK